MRMQDVKKRRADGAQRTVHDDFGHAVLTGFVVFQTHATPEVLRDVCAAINRVCRLEEGQRIRLVNPRRPPHEGESLSPPLHRLRVGGTAYDARGHLLAHLAAGTLAP